MRVRIGVAQATRELDLDVDDADAVIVAYEAAVAGGDRLVAITETDGRRHWVVVDEILYLELEAHSTKVVGFASE